MILLSQIFLLIAVELGANLKPCAATPTHQNDERDTEHRTIASASHAKRAKTAYDNPTINGGYMLTVSFRQWLISGRVQLKCK